MSQPLITHLSVPVYDIIGDNRSSTRNDQSYNYFNEITSEKNTVESKLFFILPSSYFGIPRIARQQKHLKHFD